MYKILEPRINKARRKLERLRNNPAPTVPKYNIATPAAGGGVIDYVCGGDTSGPLGTETSTSSPFTINLTKAANCAGLTYLLIGWYSAHASTSSISSVTDSQGYTDWRKTAVNPYPLLAPSSIAWSVPPPDYEAWIEVFSACRRTFPDDYSIGDTITVTMTNASQLTEVVAMVFNFTNIFEYADINNDWGSIAYGDGIDYDSAGANFPVMSYTDTWGSHVNPFHSALCLSAAVAYPAISSHTPLNGGTFIGNVMGSDISLGAHIKPLLPNEVTEPGFDMTGATYAVGEYQLIRRG